MLGAEAFHIGDVLSVVAGRLVSPRRMQGVRDLLNHMAGEILFLHQIPRVMQEAAPVLLRQHPQLTEADVEGITPENLDTRMESWISRFGMMLPVMPMTADEHECREPQSELIEMMPTDRIINLAGGHQEATPEKPRRDEPSSLTDSALATVLRQGRKQGRQFAGTVSAAQFAVALGLMPPNR